MFADFIIDKIAEVSTLTVAGTLLGSTLILFVLARKALMEMIERRDEERRWDKEWKDNEWKLEKLEYKEDKVEKETFPGEDVPF